MSPIRTFTCEDGHVRECVLNGEEDRTLAEVCCVKCGKQAVRDDDRVSAVARRNPEHGLQK